MPNPQVNSKDAALRFAFFSALNFTKPYLYHHYSSKYFLKSKNPQMYLVANSNCSSIVRYVSNG